MKYIIDTQLVAAGVAALGLHPRDIQVSFDQLLVEGSQAVGSHIDESSHGPGTLRALTLRP